MVVVVVLGVDIAAVASAVAWQADVGSRNFAHSSFLGHHHHHLAAGPIPDMSQAFYCTGSQGFLYF